MSKDGIGCICYSAQTNESKHMQIRRFNVHDIRERITFLELQKEELYLVILAYELETWVGFLRSYSDFVALMTVDILVHCYNLRQITECPKEVFDESVHLVVTPTSYEFYFAKRCPQSRRIEDPLITFGADRSCYFQKYALRCSVCHLAWPRPTFESIQCVI